MDCIPSGLVSFVLYAWGGQISEWELTEKSGHFDLCDLTMADRGFDIRNQ